MESLAHLENERKIWNWNLFLILSREWGTYISF
jgi:hypothetical protein